VCKVQAPQSYASIEGHEGISRYVQSFTRLQPLRVSPHNASIDGNRTRGDALIIVPGCTEQICAIHISLLDSLFVLTF
jgi:hypothetical protein